MNQSKLGSLIEAIANVAIGSIVALMTQLIVLPRLGIRVPLTTNLWMVFWFTLVSVVRSYAVRRWFEGRLRRASQHIARRISE